MNLSLLDTQKSASIWWSNTKISATLTAQVSNPDHMLQFNDMWRNIGSWHICEHHLTHTAQTCRLNMPLYYIGTLWWQCPPQKNSVHCPELSLEFKLSTCIQICEVSVQSTICWKCQNKSDLWRPQCGSDLALNHQGIDTGPLGCLSLGHCWQILLVPKLFMWDLRGLDLFQDAPWMLD